MDPATRVREFLLDNIGHMTHPGQASFDLGVTALVCACLTVEPPVALWSLVTSNWTNRAHHLRTQQGGDANPTRSHPRCYHLVLQRLTATARLLVDQCPAGWRGSRG